MADAYLAEMNQNHGRGWLRCIRDVETAAQHEWPGNGPMAHLNGARRESVGVRWRLIER